MFMGRGKSENMSYSGRLTNIKEKEKERK